MVGDVVCSWLVSSFLRFPHDKGTDLKCGLSKRDVDAILCNNLVEMPGGRSHPVDVVWQVVLSNPSYSIICVKPDYPVCGRIVSGGWVELPQALRIQYSGDRSKADLKIRRDYRWVNFTNRVERGIFLADLTWSPLWRTFEFQLSTPAPWSHDAKIILRLIHGGSSLRLSRQRNTC